MSISVRICFFLVIPVLLFGGCKSTVPDPVAATLILKNAKVWTGNRSRPEAEAVAIRGHDIVYVGTNKKALALAGKNTRILDLEGKRMVPGFIDGHMHFLTLAREPMPHADLITTVSEEDFARRIGEAVRKLPKGKWFSGGPWKYDQWKDPHLPTRKVLDRYTPDNPVYIAGSAGHFAMVNSKALEIAGIDRNTPDPFGGEIVRYPGTNIPTGLLKNNAMDLVGKYVDIKKLSFDKQVERALKKLEKANAVGVTAVDENLDDVETIRLYNTLLSEGKLTVRAHIYAKIGKLNVWLESGLATDIGNRYIHFCGLKAQTDGALGSSSAYFYEPYKDSPGNYGIVMEDLSPGGSLERRFRVCVENGIQPMAHAIGDRAIHEVLEMFERIGGKDYAKYRFRMEHVQHPRPEDIKRMGEMKIIVSVQPNSAVEDAAMAEKRLGEKRCKTTYPFRDFLDAGAIMAFGSDGGMDPVRGIYFAVTRNTLDNKYPGGWQPHQKITVEEALRAYTWGTAYASFFDHRTGSLEPGKLADMVVLDQDILNIPHDKIKDVRVVMTIVDGKVVFETK